MNLISLKTFKAEALESIIETAWNWETEFLNKQD